MLSVAAASIIARYAFLKEMDRLTEIAGTTIPKGASAKVDEIAAKIYLKHGETFLKSITKWHFANTQKAQHIANKKSVTIFVHSRTQRLLLLKRESQLVKV